MKIFNQTVLFGCAAVSSFYCYADDAEVKQIEASQKALQDKHSKSLTKLLLLGILFLSRQLNGIFFVFSVF